MLPKNLKYQNKVESATARQYTSVISPQNGSGPYVFGSTPIINIPTGRNLVMVGSESYLKYRLVSRSPGATNGTDVLRLDGAGAHGVIQRLRSFHGGKILEDIDNYHVLAAKLLALQQSSDSARNKLNITTGLTNAMYVDTTTREVYDNAVGDRLIPFATSPAVAVDTVITSPMYTIPLLSLFGTLSNQYIPLFAMTSGPVRIELQMVSEISKMLVSGFNAFASSGLHATFANHYIDNVEFVASFIELSDTAVDTIMQSLQGQPLQFVGTQYRNYIDTKTLSSANAVPVTINVPAKFSSLKSLFCVMRDKPDGALGFFSQSSPHFNVTEYRVRIGGELLPAKAPGSMAEYFTELVKAIGSISDTNHEPTISNFTYSNDAISVISGETNVLITNAVKCNNFMLGFDCETYANADKDSIFAGMNTVNKDIYWNITHGATTGSPVVRYDVYAMYDAVYVCENGNMDVRF